MPTNTLNDARCKAAKPAEKPCKLFDGEGLHLYIAVTGSKVWRLAYRFQGKPKTMSFGPYPEVSLAAARAARDAAKATLRDGRDPMAARHQARATYLLGEAVRAYWSGRKDITDGYRDNALRAIENHLEALLRRPVASITRADLLDELRVMDAAGLHVYVRKVRMWINQVFDWAVENEYCAENPAASIKAEKAFGKSEVVSFAALEPREVPDFMGRLSMERDYNSVLACRLLAYTWVRTNELRMMLPEELDLDAGVWIIPAGKMKRRRDHVVSLSTQAVKLLREVLERSRGCKYVFRGVNKDRPMSENAILYLIARIGYKGRMTGHGWRSVASTWANERGYNPDAIEMQLAHVPKDQTRAVYNRSKYFAERQRMLQDWADWLDACTPVWATITPD